jgi:DSF synthase
MLEMSLKNHPNTRPFTEAGSLSQMSVWYEYERNILWTMMRPQPRQCFNLDLLEEISTVVQAARESRMQIDFWVSGSTVPGIYNLGGDLSYFAQQIRAGDRGRLLAYAHSCVRTVHLAMTGFGVGAITIAMVDGVALGGGFEGALAHNYILAQKGAKLGFPEISFHLYPGMGAYSLVTRKAHMRLAEQLISTGESFTAEWHHERGLVDHVFEPGEAYSSTHSFIDGMRPKLTSLRALLHMRHRVLQVTESELLDITGDWVDAALRLNDNDLAQIERLVMLQNARGLKDPAASLVA